MFIASNSSSCCCNNSDDSDTKSFDDLSRYNVLSGGVDPRPHSAITNSTSSTGGIVKNKTLDYQVPDLYLHNPHFWRGMIDGDGCIFKYKKQYTTYGVSLVGTKHTIDTFKKFCEFILDKPVKVKPYKIKSATEGHTGTLPFTTVFIQASCCTLASVIISSGVSGAL